MGRRWTARGLCGERFCGDAGTKKVHDLDHETATCHIEEVIDRREMVAFRTLDCAHDQGYWDCPVCIRKEDRRQPWGARRRHLARLLDVRDRGDRTHSPGG
jgi:hypothetical protein